MAKGSLFLFDTNNVAFVFLVIISTSSLESLGHCHAFDRCLTSSADRSVEKECAIKFKATLGVNQDLFLFFHPLTHHKTATAS
jgi:hypothetical protein